MPATPDAPPADPPSDQRRQRRRLADPAGHRAPGRRRRRRPAGHGPAPPLTRRQLPDGARASAASGWAWSAIAGVVVVALVIVAGGRVRRAQGGDVQVTTRRRGPRDGAAADPGCRTGRRSASCCSRTDPATGNGVEVLVPSSLITDVCGVGQVDFGRPWRLPNGAAVSRQAVSAALGGVTVDGSWVLSEATVRQADQRCRRGDGRRRHERDQPRRRTGPPRSYIRRATQHLTGAQAVEYATYQPSADEDAAGAAEPAEARRRRA